MQTIVPIANVEVRKRQRSEIPPDHIKSLRESILSIGLLHPPVCWFDEEKDCWVLTAGECRFRTIEAIAKDQLTFRCGLDVVPAGFIPITRLVENIAELAFEAELDENVRRLDLTWQDRSRAYADLHTMRQSQNPKHTLADTKAELVQLKAPSLHSGAPMQTANTNAAEVREAQLIAENLHDPKVANARNAREAVQYIYRREEEKINAALIKRSLVETPSANDYTVHLGDLCDVLPTLPDALVDLILADPPYGIAASTGGFRARTVVHHNYVDTPEVAKNLAQVILIEGWRLTKPRANLFMFCDIRLFDFLKTAAAKMGWVPFERPLIWVKSESEGMAPWGGSGPRITTEFLFYATKGGRGMNVSPTDVFDDRRVSRTERVHGAQKPVDLLRKLIECTTLPGDLVLDPCCGSGSTLVAAKELRRKAVGIEKDPDYHTTAFTRVHSSDETKEALPDVKENPV